MKSRTYGFNLGEYQGFVLYDAAQSHTAQELIAAPDPQEIAALAGEFAFTVDKIPVGYNNLLFKAAGQYVLVDAGIPRPPGKLHLGLRDLGIEPGDIAMIVITHSDWDHVGGILDGKGGLAFPNAGYIVLEDAWQHWLTEEKRIELARLNRWVEGRMELIGQTYSRIADRVRTVRAGEEFLPGFLLLPAVGHRYDHSVLKITSGDERLLHVADAIVHPLFVKKWEWSSTYDADPGRAVEARVALLNICASENALVFGPHFPFPGLGRVRKDCENWNWQLIKRS